MFPPSAKKTVIFLLAVLLLPVFAAADDDDDDRGKHKKRYPIDLEIISPLPPKNRKSGKPKKSKMIQYRSGWPLTLKLITTDKHLEGTLINAVAEPVNGDYPEAGAMSSLVFDSGTDGCPWIEGRAFLGILHGCPVQPDLDEVWLEFVPDVDFPGTEDVAGYGRTDIQELLNEPEDPPEWGGPKLPYANLDGVGYGPNDDLPGLVLLSNVGVGVVYAPLVITSDYCHWSGSPPLQIYVCDDYGARPTDWRRAGPDSENVDYQVEARHNLAGMMGSVAYELNDQKRQTTITTSLVVPRYLFSHMVLVDTCWTGVPWAGGPSETNCPHQARIIDGGPIVLSNNAGFDADITVAEIRAFVVNGDAPAQLEDCNADGKVTADDVVCEGYTLISNEIVLNVEQWGGQLEPCNIVVESWGPVFPNQHAFGQNYNDAADFDLNTPEFMQLISCPGGGGGISKPPR